MKLVKNKTSKMKVLECLENFAGPVDEEALKGVKIDEREMEYIISAMCNERFTYEESLVRMGLARERKKLVGEPTYSITIKGRFVIRYVYRLELEEML